MVAQTQKPTTTSTITLIPAAVSSQQIQSNSEKMKNKLNEGKQRIMPSHHVEYLLEIYSQYLNKRMLESGRLSKGIESFIMTHL